MTRRTFETRILQDDGSSATAVEIPFDPKEAFGKLRAPVRATIGGHTYRTTVFRMGGTTFIPLNKENRAAAGVSGGEKATVTLELDTAARTVTPPPELAEALAASPVLTAAWRELSYTAQRENTESITSAKRPETRERRLAKTLALLGGRR